MAVNEAGSVAPAVALVGPVGALALGGPTGRELNAQLREAIALADPLDALLHALSAYGLRRLPGFGCVIREGTDARVLVRGDVIVRVVDGAGTRSLSAAGVTTWAEMVVVAPHELTIERGGVDLVSLVFPAQAIAGGSIAVAPPAAPAVTPAPPAPSRADDTIVPDDEPTEAAPVAVDEPAPWTPSSVQASDDDAPFDLSHLVGETQHRSVEAAAIRPEQQAEPEPEPDPDPQPEPAPVAVREVPPPTEPAPRGRPASPSEGGLIDHVPSRSVRARRPEEPMGAAVSAEYHPVGTDGDHDGHTVSAAQLRAARAGLGPAKAPGGPTVQAVRCVQGHLNPPHAAACRQCGGAIDDRTVATVSRPSLGRLRFVDGLVVELDRPLLLGRKPRARRQVSVGTEGLVALPDPEQLLSRTHAEVRLEDWQVLVLDCGSTNGTVVELPGAEPQQLRPEEPCLITPGTKVNLGDGAAFVFEVVV